MTANIRRARPTQAGRANPSRKSALRSAFARVERDPTGTVVLPTGTTDTEEVARVLTALNCARRGGRK
jgi:hypothetical protein